MTIKGTQIALVKSPKTKSKTAKVSNIATKYMLKTGNWIPMDTNHWAVGSMFCHFGTVVS